VSKLSTEGLALVLTTGRLHWNSAAQEPSLCKRDPHDHPANGQVFAKGGYQPRHLYEVQHPPEIVRQDW
jgi:hypothetical protein